MMETAADDGEEVKKATEPNERLTVAVPAVL